MRSIDYADAPSGSDPITGRGSRDAVAGRGRWRRSITLLVAVVGTTALGALAGGDPANRSHHPSPIDASAATSPVSAIRSFHDEGPGTDAIATARPASPIRSFVEDGIPTNVSGAVTGRLSFGALLAPDGIERPHWRSFDDVGPVPEAAPSDGPRFVVAIDPGHGGSDPGAEGPNGLLEKDLTLDIARRVELFLSELDDVEVVLTRERDRGLSRSARVQRVRASGADLFVSLHFNHLPQSEITLVESFYAGPGNIAESQALQRAKDASSHVHRTTGESPLDLAFTRGSARFAEYVQRRVFDEVGRGNEKALDAGVKADTLFVLTRSFTSGALVELTCLSNVDEAERLTDEDYRDSLAAGIADAIREYRASLETRPIDGTGA